MSNISGKELRIEKDTADRMVLKAFKNSVLIVFLLAIVVYLITASTIARYMYTTSIGLQYVTTPSFESGIAEPGSAVLVKPGSKNTFSLGENLMNSFIPHKNVAKVVILEGNFGAPDWKDYDGLEPTETGLLDNQYVAQCVLGCEPGAFVIIDDEAIIGSVSKD